MHITAYHCISLHIISFRMQYKENSGGVVAESAVQQQWQRHPMAEPPQVESEFEFWRKLGSPTKVVAPMVDHSDLAYRMQTRKYGADLVYTQMFNANSFVSSKEYRSTGFTTCPEDRPLIVQFAGHDPETILKAAKFVEDQCDAVELNLGCPQNIAKRGRYGAFLMEELDLLADIVRTLSQNLKIPVMCKSRIYKDYDRTILLYETLAQAGASALTVHGRTREEKGQDVRACDFDMIKRIKQHFAGRLPIIANGGIECLDDVYTCIQETGVDGVMSSEAILENPALYTRGLDPTNNNEIRTQIDLAEEYLDYAEKYPPRHMKTVRSHIQKMLHRYIVQHVELRVMNGEAHSLEEFRAVCQHCRELIGDKPDSDYDVSWYRRYRVGDAGEVMAAGQDSKRAATEQLNMANSFMQATAPGVDGGIWGSNSNNGGADCEGRDGNGDGDDGEQCAGVFDFMFGTADEDGGYS